MIGGFATASGDFLLVREETVDSSSWLPTAQNVNAGISVASVSVSISGSELAVLLLDESGETSYALHVEGIASVTGLPGVTLSGTMLLQANTTGGQVVDFGEYGEIDFGTSIEFSPSRN